MKDEEFKIAKIKFEYSLEMKIIFCCYAFLDLFSHLEI